jgi:hypothetical protein
MGKIRYAYDTASGEEIENKPDTGLAIDPAECDQGPEIRDDVVDPGGRPGGADLESETGPERRFYVYYLRRPDKIDPLELRPGCPFYVGKGYNCRYSEHRREAKRLLHKSGKKLYKIAIIHKLWKQGLDFDEDIVFDNLTEQEAFEIEIQAIAAYGRKNNGTGILANMTDGGDGSVGLKHTEETIAKMRDTHLGMLHTNESKNKISTALSGRVRPKEWCDAISEGKKGKPVSLEVRKIYSDAQKIRHKENPFNKKTREKLRIANLGPNNPMYGKEFSPEHCEKIRQHHLGRKQSKETCEKRSQSLKRTNKLKRWDKIINNFIRMVTKSDTNRRLAY